MAEQKTYVKCSAKEHTFQDGGKILKLSFSVAELIKFAEQHKNEKGYLNLIVAARREPGQYGDTHCVSLDTWKPKAGSAPKDSSKVPF